MTACGTCCAGDEIPDLVSARKSIGHSHVLPPDCRAPDLAWPILCKLLHKACERLRSHGLLAGAITIQLAFFLRGHSWAVEARTEETDSTITLMRLLDRLWRDRPEPRCQILQVGLVLRLGHTPPPPQTASVWRRRCFGQRLPFTAGFLRPGPNLFEQ